MTRRSCSAHTQRSGGSDGEGAARQLLCGLGFGMVVVGVVVVGVDEVWLLPVP